VAEGKGQAGGSSEVTLHWRARYPGGLFVDPGVYITAREVLGRVEQQQQAYVEAGRPPHGCASPTPEEFIAQQRRELDEARQDLTRARQLAQGVSTSPSGASARHWQKLLDDEHATHERAMPALEGERAAHEDALTGQLGSLEDRLREQEDMVHEDSAKIYELRIKADRSAGEAETASLASL
jgi:hypothetical protein